MYQIGNSEVEAVRRVIERQQLFRYQGPGVETECTQFEHEFAHYLQSPHALLLSSGTNALVAGLKALGIGAGDEVIVPCFTYVATVAAVLQVGAAPVVVAVDEHLGLCPSASAKALTSRTKALIAVHMDGMNCQLDQLAELAQAHGLFLVEDVAQAVGGSYRGRMLGTIGDVGCFSFNADKIITCGEGGALVCQDETIYQKALMAHDVGAAFGRTYKDYLASTPLEVGFSMRVSEISAAIMREQLKRLPSLLLLLRERHQLLRDKLLGAGLPLITAADLAGDCGTSILLRTNDPLELLERSRALGKAMVKVMSLTARPAYASWQWERILGWAEADLLLLRKRLAPTQLHLSSVLKIYVEPQLELPQIERQAQTIIQVMQS